jgi:two-component sensor histidine kinase
MKDSMTRVLAFALAIVLLLILAAIQFFYTSSEPPETNYGPLMRESKDDTGRMEVIKEEDSGPEEIKWGEIIKDIQVGMDNHSVMARRVNGIDDIEIPVKEKRVVFHIHHSQGHSGDDFFYEFKLEGFDLQWNNRDAGMKRAMYTNLEPGTYVFKIKRLRMKEGKVKETVEESVNVTVIPHFWASSWFRLALVALGVGAIVAYVKIKISRVKKYREQELKLSRVQSQLSEAELKALKAQLHPHFLFNTLNVISSLMHENVEAADEVLTRLGDLLRLMFSHAGQQMVALKSEIEFISIYLELHQVRFQDKLEVVMEIADDTMAAQVPNLLLQPLVENAVIHGASKEKEDNKILIRSMQKNGRLFIRIRDNGPGIPELDSGDLMDIKKGFGLKSTLERLKIGYESDYDFKVENSMEGGLIVSLEIPYNE